MSETLAKVTIADALDRLIDGGVTFRFTAYDGSATGPEDAAMHLELLNERGLSYLLTAPGDLGFARAYVTGDLVLHGVHPGNPYDCLLYTSDAADDLLCVDLGGRRII